MLYVEEAMAIVRERVEKIIKEDSFPHIIIIVGAGHHSVNHVAKIKPEVEKYLSEKHIPFIEKNVGCLEIMVTDLHCHCSVF